MPSGEIMTTLSFTARKIDRIAEHKTPMLVVPMFEDHVLDEDLDRIDAQFGGALSQTLALGDFSAKPGSHVALAGNKSIQRVIMIGCGFAASFDTAAQHKFAETAATAMAKGKARDATLNLASLPVTSADLGTILEVFAKHVTMACYVYDATIAKPKETPVLKKVTVNAGAILSPAKTKGPLGVGQAIGEGTNLTRNLVNLPGNVCTPRYLSQQGRSLAKRYESIKTTVLGEKKMQELGMGSLLSVGHGSDQESQLIIMEYSGGKAKDAPYALVGKGITFDTGGISLKPGMKMDEMKFDMGGAGSVFGTLQAIADMKLPINVVGVVAAAENMPSGRATKPGDVVKSMSGKTIEILNTDAEGRLVLCDALTYVGRYKPREVVDIATLTGTIIVALGNLATGIFANDDDLANALLDAGNKSNDRGWQLPIWDDYQKQLDSRFADVANIGTGGAGSVTAACFLARFAEKYKWAHLDVAGSAFSSSPKGATGRPVPMLVEYLRARAGR